MNRSELAQLYKQAVVGSSKDVALVVLSQYQLDFFENFLYYANKSALTPIVVIAEDLLAYNAASNKGLPAFLLPRSRYCNDSNAEPRLVVARDSLQMGYNVFLLNPMVVFNCVDIWKHFSSAGSNLDAFFFENSWISHDLITQAVDLEVFYIQSSEKYAVVKEFEAKLIFFLCARRSIALLTTLALTNETTSPLNPRSALKQMQAINFNMGNLALFPDGKALKERTVTDRSLMIRNNWQMASSIVRKAYLRDTSLWFNTSAELDALQASESGFLKYIPNNNVSLSRQALSLQTAITLAKSLKRRIVLPSFRSRAGVRH